MAHHCSTNAEKHGARCLANPARVAVAEQLARNTLRLASGHRAEQLPACARCTAIGPKKLLAEDHLPALTALTTRRARGTSSGGRWAPNFPALTCSTSLHSPRVCVNRPVKSFAAYLAEKKNLTALFGERISAQDPGQHTRCVGCIPAAHVCLADPVSTAVLWLRSTQEQKLHFSLPCKLPRACLFSYGMLLLSVCATPL
ncbi:hypothetical protein FA95DRAFT_980971 [Auriscalpium vulgare]|uniref:Uncharacterized protein n=1 Tax=Auriscalpium vulgare TaxID=40419 RepID=A0ACB8RYV1_9AGAM|nr:hypothetical protein FA95DRAFT_980971 [Auriscalpium vulgare]